MTDGGSAMKAAETRNGLEELSVIHDPYQNGKQEVFWGPVENRLMAMLEGVEHLTLERPRRRG